VAPEVVLQEVVELLDGVEVAAGRHEGAAGQRFVDGQVLAAVELVDRNFPDRKRPGRTLAAVAGALVRDPESDATQFVKISTGNEIMILNARQTEKKMGSFYLKMLLVYFL
jgi:hypothetical protein